MKDEKITESEEYRQKQKQIGQVKNKISKIEEEISRLEKEIEAYNEKLMDPSKYADVVNDKKMFADYEVKKKKLEEKIGEWEKLEGELEKLGK